MNSRDENVLLGIGLFILCMYIHACGTSIDGHGPQWLLLAHLPTGVPFFAYGLIFNSTIRKLLGFENWARKYVVVIKLST